MSGPTLGVLDSPQPVCSTLGWPPPRQPHKRENMLGLPHLEVSVSSRGEGLSQQSQLSGPGTRLIKLASCIPWCTTVSEAFPRPPLEQGAALWPTGASALTACGRQ